jgi:benzoyl-CoA 2,3-dioxygenase component A
LSTPVKQHLIDPEICIRCYTCETTCPIGAITHNDDNVVVDAAQCNHCMDCIAPCPTGSIDEWRVVNTPYTLEQQLAFEELPAQVEFPPGDADSSLEALDDTVAALLVEAHAGAGGRESAPVSASKPTINLYNPGRPAEAVVQGNYRLTTDDADSDVRHIIIDLGSLPFPVLEGQSVGITPPGTDADGKAFLPRLYSLSSPRDGERPDHNNLALTVKREERGVCSNYLCDLAKGDSVRLTGPFGATFLLPNDPQATILMICTGTGSAPFRGFTMRRQRIYAQGGAPMRLLFGARTPESLPYFGPLKKVPDSLLKKTFAFSRVGAEQRAYVQDRMRENVAVYSSYLTDPAAHIYICGLRAMEEGVDEAFAYIASRIGVDWVATRDSMRSAGRYHVETW